VVKSGQVELTVADAVIILGSVDIVLGEVDR
jgi:NADH:ubiquinone oxidoreductase subunit D